MNQELEPEIVELLKAGKKIEAIKMIRERQNIGLKEAKDIADSYCSDNNIVGISKGGMGSISSLALLIAIAVIGYYVFNHLI